MRCKQNDYCLNSTWGSKKKTKGSFSSKKKKVPKKNPKRRRRRKKWGKRSTEKTKTEMTVCIWAAGPTSMELGHDKAQIYYVQLRRPNGRLP